MSDEKNSGGGGALIALGALGLGAYLLARNNGAQPTEKAYATRVTLASSLTVEILRDVSGSPVVVTSLSPEDKFDVRIGFNLNNPTGDETVFAVTVSDGTLENSHYDYISWSGLSISDKILIQDHNNQSYPFTMKVNQPTLHIQAYVFPGTNPNPPFLTQYPKSVGAGGWY